MDYIPPVGGAADAPYIDGNPNTGTEGSIPPAAAIEHPMREIVNAITALGGEADSGNLTQLGAVIAMAIAAGESPGVPTGTVISGYYASAPMGYIETAGVELLRTTYANLYNHAAAEGLIVPEAAWQAGEYGMFSNGDGATTFRTPDLRSEFLRGWDHGRGLDGGRALGSLQSDQLISHDHAIYQRTSVDTMQAGTNTTQNTLQATSDNNDKLTAATGGAETRPRNVAIMHCIKY
ncbi:hypothetical protein [Candidatus Vondammii sp. HM_W22]|uniref:hypothetical protein n=1 Tax=Candidatus Vondammii sp. HM_W22 TaxID=2687299 RepID=UPI001F134704|nr:hypothetical protein [Candidatus Vondammii sp. HM_W22]